MTHGLTYTRVRLVVAGSVLACLLVGCSLSSSRYPADLRYPVRGDLLVQEIGGGDLRQLPGPGQLQQSIVKASQVANAKTFDPGKLEDRSKRELSDALTEVFGTPLAPSLGPVDPEAITPEMSKVYLKTSEDDRILYARTLGKELQESDLKPDDVEGLKLGPRTLYAGSRLYRNHCLHCHGVAGDGRGPTGPWVHPHPRDYRSGKFKFISTGLTVRNRKPRRADLVRTIEKGIDGTSMPAFGLLPREEQERLASYVMHLSIRGEVEFDTMKLLISGAEPEGGSIKNHVYQKTAVFLAQWADSNSKDANKPPAAPEVDEADEAAKHKSIRNGYQIFLGKGACIGCHYDFGRQSPYRYDDWGTLVRPANLTHGTYRGGRRPIDLYWRISGGIPPSGMSGVPKEVSDTELWDLIAFVQTLPYPAMLPPDVRKKIYGPSGPEKAPVARASK